MQLTEDQVERTLAARREDEQDARRVGDDEPIVLPCVPPEVVERLARTPAVRTAAVARARRRLEAGERPSAAELAGSVVGRLVCDRLR
jgi:hypothetical protein